MALPSNVLVIPGLGGSGPEHWQTRWEREHGYVRVEQADWDHPSRVAWLRELERALAQRAGPVVLVAHSLGCALVASLVRDAGPAVGRIEAALLVAPADVDDPSHTPDVTRCFAPLPLARLPFPSIVVASTDDPYIRIERAKHFADCWGSRFEDVGARGHINADSNLDAWPAGHRFLLELIRA